MSANKTRLTIYRDKADQWRWNLAYGRFTVADSGQGYTRKASCWRGWQRVELAATTDAYEVVIES